MKRAVKRIFIAAVLLFVIVIAAGYFVIHSQFFRDYARRKIISYATAKIGAPVRMSSLAIDWGALAADVRGVRIYGREGLSAPPVFEVDHVRVNVHIISLWHRQFGIGSLALDRPIIRIKVDSAGRSNLPTPPPSKSKTTFVTTLFDLQIQRFEIQSGQIYCNDEKIPLSAQLNDVRASAAFNRAAQQYAGTFSYRDGKITARDYEPVDHSLNLRFVASADEFTAAPLLLSIGASTVRLDARLANYAHPKITGRYQATILTAELARILKSPGLPEGKVATSGTFAYLPQAARPFLDCVSLDGSLSSPSLSVSVRRVDSRVTALSASYQLAAGKLSVRKLNAGLLGGSISGSAVVTDLTSAPGYSVNASLRRVSLAALNDSMPVGAVERIRLTGTASANLQAAWSRPSNLTAHAQVSFSAASAPQRGGPAVPLSGTLAVAYDAARNRATFGQSHLRAGSTQLSLAGTLGPHSKLQVSARTSDLHETAILASLFASPTNARPNRQSAPSPLLAQRIGGSAQFQGQVLGSPRDPLIDGQIATGAANVSHFTWRSLRATIHASSSQFAVSNGLLQIDERAKLSFGARAALQHWSLSPDAPLSAHVSTTSVNLARVEDALGRHDPVSGTLSATLDLSGSRQKPAGHANVHIQNASAWGQPIQNATLSLTSDGQSVRSTAALHLPAGQASGTASYSLADKTFQASLTTPAITIAQLTPVKSRGLDVSGTLSGSLSAHGAISNPSLTGDLRATKLEVRGQPIGDTTAHFATAQRQLNFAAQSSVDSGPLTAKGTIALAGNYDVNATLDTGSLPLGPLLASYVSGIPEDVKSQAELHAQITGPLRNPREIHAHAEIRQFHLAYQSVQLGLAQPLRMDYNAGGLTIQPANLKGTGTDLRFQGFVPIQSKSALNLTVHGSVDLSVLQQLDSNLTSSGRVNINVQASGSGSATPAMRGDIHIVDAAFVTATVPVGIEKANGDIAIDGNRISISKLTAAAGGGTLNIEGSAAYGHDSQFNLSLQAQSVRVRYPEGIRSVLNANLQWNGTSAASELAGQVVIDRLSFTQQFDLSALVGQFAGSPGAATPSPFQHHVKLNVAVQSGSELRLASSKLSMAGATNLNVTGTLANPVILGRVSLTSGEVFFMGKRYEVQSGTIEFSNPVRTEPVLNVYVQTAVAQYKITLNFVGPVNRLRTNYTSEPALSAADIINLLAFGKTAAEAASTGSTPATLGAESVLAQGAASQVSGKLENLTGISQLTINPLAGSNQSNPGAQVAIQERVTGSLLLTFSTDVTSTQNTAVQVQYRVTPRVSVSVLRDQNGGYALDVRLRKTF